jgi:hypothetical protein
LGPLEFGLLARSTQPHRETRLERGRIVNTAAPADETQLKKLRCPDCGTKGQFPASITQKNVSDYCEVCRYHLNHELTHDFRCAVCVARLWFSRLQAIRILLLHSALLRSEEMR